MPRGVALSALVCQWRFPYSIMLAIIIQLILWCSPADKPASGISQPTAESCKMFSSTDLSSGYGEEGMRGASLIRDGAEGAAMITAT